MPLSLPPLCVVRPLSRQAPENLALEEWLLAEARPGTWRLMLSRNASCVIIGRNQNVWRECNIAALREAGAGVFRRVSGGGAVWHDEGNLNFSVIAGRDSYCVDRQFALVCRALERLGVRAARARGNALVCGGLKISGSAFCVKKSGALHHGTLLVSSDLERLERCLTAPGVAQLEDKAVRSVRARVGNLGELQPGLTMAALEDALIKAYRAEAGHPAASVVDVDVSAVESGLRSLKERHASWEWRLGESPPCVAHGRFGGRELKLAVENGVIGKAELSGAPEYGPDAAAAEVARLPEFLAGRRFDAEAIEAAIMGWRIACNAGDGATAQARAWLRELNA